MTYTRQSFMSRTFWFHNSGQRHEAGSGPVGRYLPRISVTVFTVSESSELQQLPATRLFLTSLLQRLCCELFFPATSKLPSHKRCWERPSNKSTWPRVAHSQAQIRALPPAPPGEGNASLTSLPARKSYLSCGWRRLYGLILDKCFQVLWCTTSRSFKSSTKGWKLHLQRSVSSQVSCWWSFWCASRQHKALTWMQLFTLKTEHQWIVRTL